MKSFKIIRSRFSCRTGSISTVFVLIFNLALAGCGSLVDFGSGEPPEIYRLSPTQISSTGIDGGWSLQLDNPTVIAALRGDEIAVTRSGGRIAYYADAIWFDRTSRVVQRFLVETFEGAPDVFVTSAANLPTGWTLQLDISDFTAHVGDDSLGAVVTLDISVLLLEQATPISVRGQKRFVVTERASAQTLDSVVPAFERALDQLAEDILHWLDDLAD